MKREKSTVVHGEVSQARVLAEAVAQNQDLQLVDLSSHYSEDWRGLPGNVQVGDHLVSTRGTPDWMLVALDGQPKILFLPDLSAAYQGMAPTMQSVIRSLLKDRRFPGGALPKGTGVLASMGADERLSADVANACAHIKLAGG